MTFDTPAVPAADRRHKLSLIRREVERREWTKPPRIGYVYAAENWDDVEMLVNDLRYELMDAYNFSPINMKTTQTESIYDIPLFINHSHHRSDIVFALGVVYKDSPMYDQRLVDMVTQRLSALSMPGRVPVFDCILIRDNRQHLQTHLAQLEENGTSFAKIWASRAIDTYNILSKPPL
ncbi:hypothetical protein GQ54DRAFT_257777 [Martensiomyces pterosporus]|nr:hypothetical protein GQ54DRAFT_257777 [Martensiomyces pterosporus]